MEENPQDKFAIILQDWEAPTSVPMLAEALATTTGILFADAEVQAGRTRGILARNIDRQKAEQLVAELNKLKMNAFIVPEGRLIKVPKTFNITKLTCTDESFLVSIGPGDKVYPIKWEDILSISCGYVKQVTRDKGPGFWELFGGILSMRIPYIPAMPIALVSWDWKVGHLIPQKKVDYLLMTDIVIKNPVVARFRIESKHFAYATLGDNMKQDTLDNFKELIKAIVSRAPSAYIERGIRVMLGKETTQSIIFRSIGEFDHYNAWLVQKAVHQPGQAVIKEPKMPELPGGDSERKIIPKEI
jgi:hypothetical protein